MTLRPFFRKAARLEYDEAASWYENQRPGLGSEFVAENGSGAAASLRNAATLSRNAAGHSMCAPAPVPYSIFFRIRSDRLVVLSVFHARRDPNVWRERSY